ncbi:SCO family protein [Nitrosococcus wardiae]|uniref:Redoxin domain-containing protein n=1 Tax=Nitrosococcus wardiae TaxID=1814290 RepID=A0A4P7BX70_9GAMM|nr:SCO family protein [Nitrosococcus wardiae]QBQ53724.1 redoxin domain-containing protein [Nitrosococcus wardiae]
MDNGKSKTKRGRPGWVSFAIFAICALPVIAAWWFLKALEQEGEFATRNYGELIRPARPLEETTLKTLEGKDFTLSELKGKWTLVVFGPAACDDICQENLYETRQIRLAVGKEMQRVQRLWVVNDVGSLSESDWLEEQHPDLLIASEGEKKKGFIDQFVLPKVPDPLAAQRVYIVDPIGNIVITYPPEEAPEHILKDLKRLLFVSQIG